MVLQFTSRQLISHAIAKRIETILSDNGHVGRFGILSTSVARFDPLELISLLGDLRRKKGYPIRLAMALQDNPPTLYQTAEGAGFTVDETFATNLLVAGRWRNDPTSKDIPIAISTGEQTTLHTLAAFMPISSSDVAKELLGMLRSNDSPNALHDRLFEVLTHDEFSELHSPLAVAEYASQFLAYSKEERLDAVKNLLPQLGLLRDPDLFSYGALNESIKRNIEFTRKIRHFSKTDYTGIRNRIAQLEEPGKTHLQTTLQLVEAWQKNPNTLTFEDLTLQDVIDLYQLKPIRKKKQKEEEPKESRDETLIEREDVVPPLQQTFAEALLDSDEETRNKIADAVSQAIDEERQSQESDKISIETDTVVAEYLLAKDEKLLEFVHHYCGEASYGGTVDTDQKVLRAAIDAYSPSGQVIDLNQVVSVVGNRELTLIELITELDVTTNVLVDALGKFIAARTLLLPFIDGLVLQPFVTIGANPQRRQLFQNYIDSADQLLKAFKEDYESLNLVSSIALTICVSYLLSLDVVLFKIRTDAGTAHKAMLMPLHPLYLWKFVRLVEIYEDKLQTHNLAPDEKVAILAEADNNRHFLHTLFISSIFAEKEGIALPFAGTIANLPCYENTSNHYSGNDGLRGLFYTLERYLAFYPLLVRPLRITIVDVPSLPDLLKEIEHFLNRFKIDRLPGLDVRLYFTEVSAARNYLSSLVTGENERVYQGFISSGRLTLQIGSGSVTLDGIIEEHKRKPVHLIALFDQSELEVRSFKLLQNHVSDSPFCITREYSYDGVIDEFRVIPVTDARLFSHHNDLVNRMRNNLSSNTASVVGKTQIFRDQLDIILQEQCSQWLFIADRVLPAENRMRSPRIYAKREGRREILVLASTSDHFARELDSQITQHYNLYPSRDQIQSLLLDFSHMIGDGLLSVIQAKDGTLTHSKSIGLIGLLITARHYEQLHPNALVVAVDSQDAMRWLRITDAAKRADLIGVYKDANNRFVVEVIEVKTFEDEADVFTRERSIIRGTAVDQVSSLTGALKQTFEDPTSPLTPPRREVLRDLLYKECQSRRHTSEFRKQWSEYLKALFANLTEVNVKAQIYRIDLSHPQSGRAEELVGEVNGDRTLPITYITLGEKQVQKLLKGDISAPIENAELEFDTPVSVVNNELKNEPSSQTAPPAVVRTGGGRVPFVPPIPLDQTILQFPQSETVAVTDIDTAWLNRVIKQFVEACDYYGIKVTNYDAKSAIVGSSIVRFPFRLQRGTRKEKLDRSLEDIGREIAISNLMVQSIPNSQELALDVPRPNRVIPLFHPTGLASLPEIATIDDLPLVLGVTPSGEVYSINLKSIVHMLVGGTTGAGKTVFLYSIILSLLYKHQLASELELVLCTSKLEDFAFFEGYPQLHGREIITDAALAVRVISEIANQTLPERSRLLAQERVRSIADYNQNVEPSNQIRPIVVVVDEFANLADQVANDRHAKVELYNNVRRIAEAGRSRSVHLVLCTQRPTADMFPSNIKTLMNARVAFRMNSPIDSRTILDENGAENLLGKGDMMFRSEMGTERLQGFYVSAEDLQ